MYHTVYKISRSDLKWLGNDRVITDRRSYSISSHLSIICLPCEVGLSRISLIAISCIPTWDTSSTLIPMSKYL